MAQQYPGWHPKTEDTDVNMTEAYASFPPPQQHQQPYFTQNFTTPANLPPPPPAHAIQTHISAHVQGAFNTATHQSITSHHPHCAVGGFPPPAQQACVATQQVFVPNTFHRANPSCEFKLMGDVHANDSFDSNMSGVPELQHFSSGRYESNPILKHGLITLPDGRQVYSKQAAELMRQQRCAGTPQMRRNYHSADAANPRIARHNDANPFGPPNQTFVMDVDIVPDDRRTCALPFHISAPNSQAMLPPPPRSGPLPPPPPQHSHQSSIHRKHGAQAMPSFPQNLDNLPPIPMEKPVVPRFTPPQQGGMPGGMPVALPPPQTVISTGLDRSHHAHCVQFSSNITSDVHHPPITTQISLPSNSNIFESPIMPSVGPLPPTSTPEYHEHDEESTRRTRVACARRSPSRSTCGIKKHPSRKKTNVACTNCVKAKAGCGVERPCKRCIRLKKDKCVDRPLNPKSKTKRPKRGQSRSCSASPLSEDHLSERQSPVQTMGVFGRGSPNQQNCEQRNAMISPSFFVP